MARPAVSLLLATLAFAACSSSSSGSTPSGGDAGVDAAGDASTLDGTVGKPCSSDLDCDRTGLGVTKCSTKLFPIGAVYPTPVCVGTSCDPGNGSTVAFCDGQNGICLTVGTGAECLPACTFKNDGAAPTGCAGNDACNPLGYGTDASGTEIGVGYCYGGCKADADCAGAKAGDHCQTDEGICVDTPVTRSKNVGDACTTADVHTTTPACNCAFGAGGATSGYCTSFCELGGTPACPTGFTCAAGVPKSFGDGGVSFTQDPAGLAGLCFKVCSGSTDPSCAAINAFCNTNDVAGDVCEPGAGP